MIPTFWLCYPLDWTLKLLRTSNNESSDGSVQRFCLPRSKRWTYLFGFFFSFCIIIFWKNKSLVWKRTSACRLYFFHFACGTWWTDPPPRSVVEFRLSTPGFTRFIFLWLRSIKSMLEKMLEKKKKSCWVRPYTMRSDIIKIMHSGTGYSAGQIPCCIFFCAVSAIFSHSIVKKEDAQWGAFFSKGFMVQLVFENPNEIKNPNYSGYIPDQKADSDWTKFDHKTLNLRGIHQVSCLIRF